MEIIVSVKIDRINKLVPEIGKKISVDLATEITDTTNKGSIRKVVSGGGSALPNLNRIRVLPPNQSDMCCKFD